MRCIPRAGETPDDEWRAESEEAGEVHVFCPECWRREFGGSGGRSRICSTPKHGGSRQLLDQPGAAPIPASSGQTIRYRLDRSGDRKLNRALHQVLITRRRAHPPTIDYIDRRLREGKTRREATRCLKRYLARNLYRLLENGTPMNT